MTMTVTVISVSSQIVEYLLGKRIECLRTPLSENPDSVGPQVHQPNATQSSSTNNFADSESESAKPENLEIALSTLPGRSEYRIDLLLREPDFRLLGSMSQLSYPLNVEVAVARSNFERTAVVEVMIVRVETTRSNSPSATVFCFQVAE